MLKKILKYIGITLAILSGLPLVVSPLVYTAKAAGVGSSTDFSLFEDLEGMEVFIKDFNPFWIHAMQVLVIISFVIACSMLVLALLNDLKVLKLQNVEKLLAVILTVVGVLALGTVVINQFVNSYFNTDLGEKFATGSSLVANVWGWLFPIFAMVGAVLVFVTIETKKKSKKRK